MCLQGFGSFAPRAEETKGRLTLDKLDFPGANERDQHDQILMLPLLHKPIVMMHNAIMPPTHLHARVHSDWIDRQASDAPGLYFGLIQGAGSSREVLPSDDDFVKLLQRRRRLAALVARGPQSSWLRAISLGLPTRDHAGHSRAQFSTIQCAPARWTTSIKSANEMEHSLLHHLLSVSIESRRQTTSPAVPEVD